MLSVLPTELNLVKDTYRPQEERDVKARLLWCYGSGAEDMRPHDSFLYHVRQGFKYTYGRLVGGFDRFADEPIPFRAPNTYRSFQQAIMKERGASESPNRFLIGKSHRKAGSKLDPFTFSDLFKQELSALIRLTADHGIPLMIRLTPFSGEAAEHSPKLRTWAEDLEAKNPSVMVCRPEVLLYDTELFLDEDHLNLDGAAQFTSLVATAVKDVLARGGNQTPRHPPAVSRRGDHGEGMPPTY